MKIVVLIPAHDEAERITATVRAAASLPGVSRVVVIDDGSRDETARLAGLAGAEVVEMGRNAGKGAALDAGLKRAAEADVVLLLDGDLGGSADQGACLLEPVIAGEADMTIAVFPPSAKKAGFGLVKGLARSGISLLGDRSFEASAPLSGQRALNRRALQVVTPFAFGYGVEVALTVRALRVGLGVVEVPTTMEHDATGRDLGGFVHRGGQFVHVAWALMRLSVERRRLPSTSSGTAA